MNNCKMYLSDEDELYSFANVPIFYKLANKIPTVKAVVPWFDVSSQAAIADDLDYLKSNNPKMIIFNDVGSECIEIHSELYGDKSAHADLYNWLTECRNGQYGYKVLSTYTEGPTTTTYLLLKA